jgi:hypothetical protein
VGSYPVGRFRGNSTAAAIASFARGLRQRIPAWLWKRPGSQLSRGTITAAPLPSEVVARATSRLRTSSHRVLGKTSCTYNAGVLTLRGHVPSFYLKQLAQTLVAELDEVSQIDNCLTVHNPIEISAAQQSGSFSVPAVQDI